MSRQIFFIGLSGVDIDGRHRIEAMYELSKSDRHNFKEWFREVRGMHEQFVITTTDDLKNIESTHERYDVFSGATFMNPEYVSRLNSRGAAYIPIRHCDDCDFFTRDPVTICPHRECRGHVG